MLRAAVALTLLCVGSMEGQGSESDETKRPSFTMSIALKQDTVAPGEEVTIGVELTNVSSKEIQVLRVGVGPPQYAFKVLDQNGKAAPLTPLGEAMVNGGRSRYRDSKGVTRLIVGSRISRDAVAPGHKLPDAFTLSDYVELGQPGQYTVRLERSDPDTKLLVESNSVSLTVAKIK